MGGPGSVVAVELAVGVGMPSLVCPPGEFAQSLVGLERVRVSLQGFGGGCCLTAVALLDGDLRVVPVPVGRTSGLQRSRAVVGDVALEKGKAEAIPNCKQSCGSFHIPACLVGLLWVFLRCWLRRLFPRATF